MDALNTATNDYSSELHDELRLLFAWGKEFRRGEWTGHLVRGCADFAGTVWKRPAMLTRRFPRLLTRGVNRWMLETRVLKE